MRRHFHQISGLVLTSALLAGCAGSSDQYPSLAIRDAERTSVQFTPTPGNEEAQPNKVSFAPGDIAGLVESAQESHRAFLAAQSSTAQLVSGARGSTAESEARARALVALADLTSKRSNTAIALADLDLLAAETATELASSDALDAAQDLVADLVRQEDLVLASLWEQISR